MVFSGRNVISQPRQKRIERCDDKGTDSSEKEDLVFANKLVKHSKSNAIVLAKNKQFVCSGVGQTSRVDALKQAIDKARVFGFDLKDQ
jgi:phosphoribosylaminoimidazolecarboxamide formyltransferase/IMP cyclohydrolase